jgi:hypothetical protein
MAHKNSFYEADLAGLKNSSNWPVWPLLPVKKYEKGTRMPAFGAVYAKDTKPVVYLNANVFKLGADPGLKPVENAKEGFQIMELDSSIPEELRATVADKLKAFKTQEYETFEAMLDDGWMVD